MRKTKTVEVLIVVLLGLSIIPTTTHPARAPPGSNSNYPETDFATGFGNSGGSLGVGPIGLDKNASGYWYVGDFTTKNVYKFGPSGGVASPTTELSTSTQLGNHNPHGLAIGKDGTSIYVNLADAGEIVQLDQNSGAILRVVATGLGWASGLAVDPLTGDLFVSQSGNGNTIFRISNFANGPGTVTPYATVPGADGLAFQWNGTLYTSAGGLQGIVKISGTYSPPPTLSTWTFLVGVPSIDGMAISQKPGHDLTLFANRNDGVITQVTFDRPGASPGITNIFTGGTRGDFERVGKDGCLYATQSDRIIRVANPNGGCPFGGFYDESENPVSCHAPCSSEAREAIVGSRAYLVWLNNTSGNSNILFTASSNNGSSFGPTVKITNPTNGKASNEQIAAAGSNVYVVWQQNVSLTNDHILIRRSTNNGTSFGPVVDLSIGSPVGTGTSKFPEVAATGTSEDIVWLGCTDTNCDTIGGNLIETVFRSSLASAAIALSTTAYPSGKPEIAAVASDIYLTWSDVSPGRAETFFAVSSDGGRNFGSTSNLSSSPPGEIDLYQQIAATGTNVYIAWTNQTASTGNTMFAESINSGAIFGTALNLNKANVNDLQPELAATGTNIYVVWSDATGGNTEVLYKASTNNGVSFGNLLNLSNMPGTSNEQTIAASSSNVFVTWIESGTTNNGVYFDSSSDGGATFGTPLNLISDSVSSNPVVADPVGNAYVAWEDQTTGNGDIYLVSGQPFALDYSLTSSRNISMNPGNSNSTTISATLVSGTAQTLTLSCSGGLPSGATCAFSTISGTPSFSSTLTITTQSSTPPGSYSITVTGTAGDLGFSQTRSTQVTITVNPPPPPPPTGAGGRYSS